ncbi:bidirectional sugar transporter sweet1 [Phtheirospermum japonicum]|uniref:Bidirectional sugar transporter SWEET n=1 Tax=Phtheirospermum japonicum TaxID=374723 RepID=A0A830CVU0_9LAMI|nr:bidirectional sugar transporter sweet1 [Phtheirospermum japonicum]
MDKTLHFVFGIFGNAFALFLYLAPVVTFKRIVKKRSTEQFSGIPYVMTLLNCLISSWYGLPFVSPNNLLLSTINVTGAAVQSTFVMIFLIFAQRKEKGNILLLLTIVLAFFATVVFVSLFAFHGNGRTLFCGIVTTIFATVMYASPLAIIRLVIKTKSVEFMPFFTSMFVFLCGTCWLVFGLLEKDPFVTIPSGFGSGFGAVQLILYAMYRNNKSQIEKSTVDNQFEEIEKIDGIKHHKEKPSNGPQSQDEHYSLKQNPKLSNHRSHQAGKRAVA